MIGTTLSFLASGLNERLLTSMPAADDWVVVSQVVGTDGLVPPRAMDKVAMTLVNLQRDPVFRVTEPITRATDGVIVRGNPPLEVNFEVLLSANFADERYSDALTMISAVVQHFHDNASFTAASAPDLPSGTQRVTVEWVDQDLSDTHNLWTSLGGRYAPSVVYKVRTLTLDDGRVHDAAPIVTAVSERSH